MYVETRGVLCMYVTTGQLSSGREWGRLFLTLRQIVMVQRDEWKNRLDSGVQVKIKLKQPFVKNRFNLYLCI